LSLTGTYDYYVVIFDTSYNYANRSNTVQYQYQTQPSITNQMTTSVSTTYIMPPATTAGSTVPGNRTNGPITIPQCVRLNATLGIISISTLFCYHIRFTDCEFDFYITADNTTLFEAPPYPITQFKNVFESAPTCTPAFLGCDLCSEWTNIYLNATSAAGCGALSLKCALGINFGPEPLGCFNNDNLIPECFGTCPNNCNGRGICNNGFCQCNAPYLAPDCLGTGCPDNCGGSIRGSCINNKCSCNDGFAGVGCTDYVGFGSSAASNNDYVVPLAATLGTVGGLLLLGAIGGIIFVLIRKRRQGTLTTTFNNLKSGETPRDSSRDGSEVELD